MNNDQTQSPQEKAQEVLVEKTVKPTVQPQETEGVESVNIMTGERSFKVRENKNWYPVSKYGDEIRIYRYQECEYAFIVGTKKQIFITINPYISTLIEKDLEIEKINMIIETIIFLYQFGKIAYDNNNKASFSIGTPKGKIFKPLDLNKKPYGEYKGIGNKIEGILKDFLDIKDDIDLTHTITWKILSDILYENENTSLNFRLFNITLYIKLFAIDKNYIKNIISEMIENGLIKDVDQNITNLCQKKFDITEKGQDYLDRDF